MSTVFEPRDRFADAVATIADQIIEYQAASRSRDASTTRKALRRMIANDVFKTFPHWPYEQQHKRYVADEREALHLAQARHLHAEQLDADKTAEGEARLHHEVTARQELDRLGITRRMDPRVKQSAGGGS